MMKFEWMLSSGNSVWLGRSITTRAKARVSMIGATLSSSQDVKHQIDPKRGVKTDIHAPIHRSTPSAHLPCSPSLTHVEDLQNMGTTGKSSSFAHQQASEIDDIILWEKTKITLAD